LSEKVLEALLKDPMSKAETMLDSLPDECYDEIRATVKDFSQRFEEAQREFDRVVVDYAFVLGKDIPDTLSGKASLCKWLNLARKGNGSVSMKDSVRMEYAVDVVRRKLRIEGKLKKPASKKR
jgi:hypothetical protein